MSVNGVDAEGEAGAFAEISVETFVETFAKAFAETFLFQIY